MNEQHVYARWLDWGTRISLAVLVAAFLAYVLGITPAALPLAEVPRFWGLPLERYLALSGAPSGWGWLGMLDKGDYQNLVGVALLGLVTVACYLRVLPMLLARRERLLAGFAIAQVVVLLLAASGLFAGGH
jgi:hypothetical protein